MVETVDDIIEEIAPQLARPSGGAGKTEARQLCRKTPVRRCSKVFALLQERSLQIDEMIESSGLVSAQVLGILLDLELQGYLQAIAGKNLYAVER